MDIERKVDDGLIGKHINDIKLNCDPPNSPFLRIIKPNECITMEYMPKRKNLHLDKDGIIVKVTYG